MLLLLLLLKTSFYSLIGHILVDSIDIIQYIVSGCAINIVLTTNTSSALHRLLCTAFSIAAKPTFSPHATYTT